jgi:hypothetical protein
MLAGNAALLLDGPAPNSQLKAQTASEQQQQQTRTHGGPSAGQRPVQKATQQQRQQQRYKQAAPWRHWLRTSLQRCAAAAGGGVEAQQAPRQGQHSSGGGLLGRLLGEAKQQLRRRGFAREL